MRILSWNDLAGSNKDEFQRLAPSNAPSRNWVTVLVGRNGSKKSVLLRLLLEGALGSKSYRMGAYPTVRPKIEVASDESRNQRVIAVSGTPFDRFPRQSIYQKPRNPNRFEANSNYIYLGSKSANNVIGATHMVRTLAHLLLTSAKLKIAPDIRHVFKFLGIVPSLDVRFRLSNAVIVSKQTGLLSDPVGSYDQHKFLNELERLDKEIFDEIHDARLSRKNQRAIDFVNEKKNALTLVSKNRGHTSKILSHIERISFNCENLLNSIDPEFAELVLALITLGFITATHIVVRRSIERENAPELAETDLSSGEWQLLSTLLGVALSVRNNSLILIDEPENSLHPEWQRSYIELLMKVIQGGTGMHVIIATHSSMIASGAPNECSNVVQLVKNEDGPLQISTIAIDTTYGWESNDIYQQVFNLHSTRSPSFVSMADRALELIRDGKSKNRELKTLAGKLEKIADSLPAHDPMRSILSAIKTISTREGKK